jgi:biotin carboxyl carrier protein
MASSDAIRYPEEAETVPMNLKVRIQDRLFNVKVANTKTRPIIVEVDGDVFEVWPEQINENKTTQPQSGSADLSQRIQKPQWMAVEEPARSYIARRPMIDDSASFRSGIIRAPIPGVITAVNVDVGSEVSVGEELLKLEAMKMNNSILSNRAGVVRTIHVSVGQIVRQNEELLEFSN